MKRIIRIGMDVHSKSYNLCALESIWGQKDRILAEAKVAATADEVARFIKALAKRYGLDEKTDILCGYEAGCFGYSLYHQLRERKIHCVILAPTTMPAPRGPRIKTDIRDAFEIARCLINGNYNHVYVLDDVDNDVKEYVRMRDDHKIAFKRIKQQIGAFCLRLGFQYSEGTRWTKRHLAWLRQLPLRAMQKETLDDYLLTYMHLEERLAQFDRRIEELASRERYQEKLKDLGCFLGMSTYNSLSLLVEVGDFERFVKAPQFSAFLGLVPGEHSSGDNINRLSISKAGNTHLRSLLIEAAQCYCRGIIGYKSKALKARQAGNAQEVIAYADRANVRLRKKYYRMLRHGKKRNVIVAAIARELACFIWGMMTKSYEREVA
jgi:transposase